MHSHNSIEMTFGVQTRAFLLVSFIVLANSEGSLLEIPQVPCLFIFGDSLVDNGNNNNLTTTIKANYLPYGIDFPQGPTGRFSNGRNLADFIAHLLGFKDPIPSHASAQDDDILRGVNYASGSSGIRDESGQRLGDPIFLNKQLRYHRAITSRITKLLGSHTAATNHLQKCLYYFNTGGNDYINNYFQPDYYNSSRLYNPEQYAAALIQQYSRQLKVLYHLGSRKVALSAVQALGCLPGIAHNSPNGSTCIQPINDAGDMFNDKLKLLVRKLNNECTDAKYAFVRPVAVNSPGAKFLNTPCCKVSNTTGLCIPGEAPCAARDLYVYYDNFHPTEIAYSVLGDAAYVDIKTLI